MSGYVIGINYALSDGKELRILKQIASEEGGRKIRGLNFKSLTKELKESTFLRKFPDCECGAKFLLSIREENIEIVNIYTYNGNGKGRFENIKI